MKTRRWLWGVAITVLLVAGCSDSGNSGGGGTPPTAPSPAIVVTPDRTAAAGSITVRAGDASTASLLQLEIFATDLVNVQAVDFVLLYPQSLLQLDSFAVGDFMGAGAQVVSGGPGGAASFQILRTTPAAASGSGVILTVTFSAVGAGSNRFDFLDQLVEDPFGLEITGLDWIGGRVQVVL